jgi:hypothetical protein
MALIDVPKHLLNAASERFPVLVSCAGCNHPTAAMPSRGINKVAPASKGGNPTKGKPRNVAAQQLQGGQPPQPRTFIASTSLGLAFEPESEVP